MAKNQTFLEKFYKDKQGNVVVMQRPNLPVVIGIATQLLSKLINHARAHDILVLISYGALFTWAWLELFKGANYLRRLLGLGVLILLIWNRL